MSKLVIITFELDEAEAAMRALEKSIVVTQHPSPTTRILLSFNAKLHKAIQHAKGVKRRV